MYNQVMAPFSKGKSFLNREPNFLKKETFHFRKLIKYIYIYIYIFVKDSNMFSRVIQDRNKYFKSRTYELIKVHISLVIS